MMNMDFDRLRGHVQQNTVMAGTAAMGSSSQMMTQMLGGPRGGSMMDPTRMLTRPVEVPDHPQELQVLLFGPGAEQHATRDRSVSVIDARSAEAACKASDNSRADATTRRAMSTKEARAGVGWPGSRLTLRSQVTILW